MSKIVAVSSSGNQIILDTTEESCLKFGVKPGFKFMTMAVFKKMIKSKISKIVDSDWSEATVIGVGLNPDLPHLGPQLWYVIENIIQKKE